MCQTRNISGETLKSRAVPHLGELIAGSAGGKSQADCKARAPIWPPSTSADEITLSRGQQSSTDVLCLTNKRARCLGNRGTDCVLLCTRKQRLSEQLTSLFALISSSSLAPGPHTLRQSWVLQFGPTASTMEHPRRCSQAFLA